MLYLIPTDTCFWLWCSIDDVEWYEKIYKIKKRGFDKPLAIMVRDFNWLKKHTTLTSEQITFLKEYERPFTVLTDCDSVSLWLNYESEEEIWFRNKDLYKKIAFRVAHSDTQRDLIKKTWPIFLTSANFSWEKELYSTKEVKERFDYYIKSNQVEILADNRLVLPHVVPSDIFEFVWDSLEVEYLRKG